MFKIYFIGLKKKTCLGVLERGEQGDDNETGLKEGGGIEMSIYKCFPLRDCTLSFAINTYLYKYKAYKVGRNRGNRHLILPVVIRRYPTLILS